MVDFTEVLKNRRSVRKFTDDGVSEDDIQAVLEAVKWTPSWANTQCWEIVRIKDPAVREDLQKTMGKGNPATAAITRAPVLFAVCGRMKRSGYYKGEPSTKFGDWTLFDLGLATQSLCLAAENLGLGTVIVGLFDQDAVNRILNLPEGVETVALIPMGVPAHKPSPPKRREVEEFLHIDGF